MSTSPPRVTNVLMTCRNDESTGGVQVVFRNLVRSLEQSGRTVHLLYQASRRSAALTRAENAWGHPALYCTMPAVVRRHLLLSLPLFLAFVPVTVFHLARLIRRHKIDVINCHYLSQYFVHFMIAARLLRVPLVVSVHGADVDRYARVSRAERLVLRLIMRGADAIVACSQAMARQTAETFPVARPKVTHVHNGLVLAEFAGDGPAPGPAYPFVLCVCRQVEKKGTDTLLRAFALVAQDFPDLSLIIVGDGPLLAQNTALARTLGIERQVRFLGDVPRAKVRTLMASCNLFVVPSRAEPFGLVALEAAYYRKSLVCTRVGGIPEIVTDEVDGLLVDPDDPAAMAKSMTRLLHNPEWGSELGARAHRTLMTKFLWDDRAEDYIALYERVAAGFAMRPHGGARPR